MLRKISAGFLVAVLLQSPGLHAVEELNPSQAATTGGDDGQAERAIKGFTLPKGFRCELVAAEPLLANPVAFCIDEHGRFYVAESFRANTGVPDIRNRMHWLDTELASKSVEERVAYTKRFEPKNMAWWTNHEDRISFLWDNDGDGKCDRSTVFAGGFNALPDGLGSGVLARRGAVYYTDIPNLWLLTDTNRDHVADGRKSLSYGYGVRYGFIGHDLHGLIIGPDGRLYFSIGDRGAHVVLPNGKTVDNPESGAVYRCELDGSNLEIVYTGLRNPQELAFDDQGNLWTGDNNSDAGDPARIVYLAEGGDAGWRVGWQFIEKPMARSSWLGERLCYEDFPDRAAYALPPISSKVSNGPSGLMFDPGTGLPREWRGHFFLCNFSGSPTPNSGVYAFTVKPKGAGFELGKNEKFWWDFLPTDIDFGYDGCLYATDWINGWSGLGKGRIYRLYQPDERQQPVIAQVKKLFAEGFEQRPNAELVPLLAHPDRRVRQEAQFALVAHKAQKQLTQVAIGNTNLLARLHAIWGLGQLERRGARGDFTKLLADPEPEVRAQCAKVIGDARNARYQKQLVSLLADAEPRVRYFAALSLSKFGHKENLPALTVMLRDCGGDPWLRHAGMMGLVSCATDADLTALAGDPSMDVRLAAVVALRRLASPRLERFLTDADPRVVAEAARAINDVPVPKALPALAALADTREKFAALPAGSREEPSPRDAILRRILNANFRLSTSAAVARVVAMAGDEKLPEAIRLEAVNALPDWSKPPGADHVTGLWRPLGVRTAPDFANLQPAVTELLTNRAPASVKTALLTAAAKLKWRGLGEIAFAIAQNNDLEPATRAAALQFLSAIEFPEFATALNQAAESSSEELRIAAAKLAAKSFSGDQMTTLFEKRMESGTLREKQAAFALLADAKDPAADRLLMRRLDDFLGGSLPAELQLDVLEAAAKRQDKPVKEKLGVLQKQLTMSGRQFTECQSGGDAALGKKIFREKIEASCLRCHKLNGEGGAAAPDLTGIGSRADRAYLVESIAFPNSKIATGFENVQIVLNNGQAYAGTLKSETPETLELISPEDGTVKITKAEIKSRAIGLSGMPDNMREVLTKREIRDLVEFLAGLK